MTQRKELSFDGFGINGPDEFRTRIATFAPTCKGEERDRYGELFENAPEMFQVLQDCESLLNDSRVRDYIGRKLGEQARLHSVLNRLLPLLREFNQ